MFPLEEDSIHRHFMYLDMMVCARQTAKQLPFTIDIELSQPICWTREQKNSSVTREAKELQKFEV